MPAYRIVGEKFVSQEEIAERIAFGEGQKVAEAIGRTLGMVAGQPTEFLPVGENKPLLAEIRHVYTGRFPGWSISLLKKPAMLVTSSFRSLATIKAQAKALNFIKPDIVRNFTMRNIEASRDGTPVVFYSPALTQPNNMLDIDIIFDKFDPTVLDMLGGAFTAAGGIPIFATYSAYLLAAGAITKIAGSLGERLIDGSPSFSTSYELSFARGGSPVPHEGFHILTGKDFDPKAEGLLPDVETGRIIDPANHKEYSGDHPYLVISLDGRKHDDYNSFQPMNLTADLLAQFYHVQDGQEQPLDMLLDAIKLYNDVDFKRKADKYENQLQDFPEDSEQHRQLVEKRDACLENLITELYTK